MKLPQITSEILLQIDLVPGKTTISRLLSQDESPDLKTTTVPDTAARHSCSDVSNGLCHHRFGRFKKSAFDFCSCSASGIPDPDF